MRTECGRGAGRSASAPAAPRRRRPPPLHLLAAALLVASLVLQPALAYGGRDDPLGTLRTYQRAGCDDEVVTLKCPHGTSISVEVAQYGKSGPAHALCPRQPAGGAPPAAHTATAEQHHQFNVTCLWPSALQEKWQAVPQGTWGRYSLLQTVVEACQKKRQCKFQTSPRTFGGDPCPGVRKYVEVAYKCRPYEFRSKVACEDDSVTLKCNPNARIAVYSASFGRTEYESIQCPQPQGVPEETCLVSYATEAVMRRCHGKRRCQLTAGAEMFGNPCRPQSRMYLKVVYTCVPRAVLREHLVESTGEDETDLADDDDDDFDIDDAAAFSPSPNVEGGPGARTGGAADADDRPPGRGPAAGAAGRTTPGPPPLAKASGGGGAADVGKFGGKFGPNTTPYLNYNNLFVPPSHPTGPTTIKDMLGDDVSDEKVLESNVNCTTVVPNENTEVIGFISEWINAYNYIAQNQEKFYLYLILSVTAGLLLFLGLVIGRLLVQRHRTKRNTKFHQPVPEQTLPNGFADDISEVEADIDLTTPVPMVAVHSPPASVAEVVRFNTGTLRRGAPGEADSTAPRSLNRSGNSQYYYG